MQNVEKRNLKGEKQTDAINAMQAMQGCGNVLLAQDVLRENNVHVPYLSNLRACCSAFTALQYWRVFRTFYILCLCSLQYVFFFQFFGVCEMNVFQFSFSMCGFSVFSLVVIIVHGILFLDLLQRLKAHFKLTLFFSFFNLCYQLVHIRLRVIPLLACWIVKIILLHCFLRPPFPGCFKSTLRDNVSRQQCLITIRDRCTFMWGCKAVQKRGVCQRVVRPLSCNFARLGTLLRPVGDF